MNKTDRMLAIVLELQRKGTLRAEDLAATFETSTRTIYRDIQALSESGVPILGAPGWGYSLMEGYFLPPVSFTAEEAVALLVGTDFVEKKFDSAYGQRARGARGKIEAILPAGVRKDAERARSAIRLIADEETGAGPAEKRRLEALRGAILEGRKVKFRYSAGMPGPGSGGRQSVRVVSPYGLVLTQGFWMLVGHCELRREIRHFRLSRMDELTTLEERFRLPDGFDMQGYAAPDDRNVRVRLLADPGLADRLKEKGTFYMESVEEREDGLLVTCRVRRPEELLGWILGWGADVVVLEPESLRERIREEIEKWRRRY